jgi:dTDP-glucose 4,6-dehydratase
MNVLVTGCAGFIGSHTCEELLRSGYAVTGIDSMSYAADPEKIKTLSLFDSFHFYECDINESSRIEELVRLSNITHILNFAAETHVDNSIACVDPFIYSNVLGVAKLIEVVRSTGTHLVQISTDEVYGVPDHGQIFDESFPLNPRNPYSATKASADHLILSAINTYGISAHIIRPSNNFGPGQHSEKFIPTIIRSVSLGRKVPVYGDGKQKREWTYVKDTASAIVGFLETSHQEKRTILNLSSEFQVENLKVVSTICDLMGVNPSDWIEHIRDRPGHDREYRIRNSLLLSRTSFEDSIKQTVLSATRSKN